MASTASGVPGVPVHNDVKRATTGLLLQVADLASTTGVKEWRLPGNEPVFGSQVDDKDNLFGRCGGTAVGMCDWASDGLFVTQVVFVFGNETECANYLNTSVPIHAELVHTGGQGVNFPRMVEMKHDGAESLVGKSCRIFCGPTVQAREANIAALVAGKSEEEAEVLIKLAEKAIHLVYLFASGRIMIKVRVTTHNGLTPLGHGHALAAKAHAVAQKWQVQHGNGSSAVLGKDALRKAFKERALASQQQNVNHPSSPDKSTACDGNTPEANRSTNHMWAENRNSNNAYFVVELFVAAIGAGVLDPATPRRLLERLQHSVTKVPREQIFKIPADKSRRQEEEVKLRIFVANSEDAKAVQTYLATHKRQRPSPFVVLCAQLPLAMEYDKNQIDPADQNTADRFRKQAKTRAVKLMREMILERRGELQGQVLNGELGANAPADLLADSVAKRTLTLNEKTQEKGIAFSMGHRNSGLFQQPANKGWQSEEEEDPEEEEEEEEDDEEEGQVSALDCLLQLATQACQDAESSKTSSDGTDSGAETKSSEEIRLGKRKSAERTAT